MPSTQTTRRIVAKFILEKYDENKKHLYSMTAKHDGEGEVSIWDERDYDFYYKRMTTDDFMEMMYIKVKYTPKDKFDKMLFNVSIQESDDFGSVDDDIELINRCDKLNDIDWEEYLSFIKSVMKDIKSCEVLTCHYIDSSWDTAIDVSIDSDEDDN
jgi:hypothetical protein